MMQTGCNICNIVGRGIRMPRRIDDLADEVLAASDTGLPRRAAGLTVRDFLAPNDYWHPKSLKRLRGAGESDTAKAVSDATPIATRKSA